jgi:diacylglycerol kinase (ATP)
VKHSPDRRWRKLALIYNPNAGTRLAHTGSRLKNLVATLASHGVEAEAFRSETPAVAAQQTQHAISSGCQAVIACGGDGTFHQLLQLAAGGDIQVPLGVVPFGSGNLLAGEFGIKPSPVAAVASLLGSEAVPMHIGILKNERDATAQRYFAVAAGVGADARVICGVNPRLKSVLGMGAYYTESLRQLLFDHPQIDFFQTEFVDLRTGETRRHEVTQLIVERVRYFGACLAHANGFAGASEALRLVLFLTDRRSAYIGYGARLLMARLGLPPGRVDGVEVAYTRRIVCTPLEAGNVAARPDSPGVLAEVDGELFGKIPVELAIAPQTIPVLMPAARAAEAQTEAREAKA